LGQIHVVWMAYVLKYSEIYVHFIVYRYTV
jgi:hypothetical protein